MKLYDIFHVVDNKTVRKHENFYKRFKKASKEAPGIMVKTNRGYFIDNQFLERFDNSERFVRIVDFTNKIRVS